MHFTHKGAKNPSPETSCSDCKLELIRKTWTGVLLNWLHKCVTSEVHIKHLSPRCLVEIINKYKEDICDDDIDRAILCTDDLEPFLRYKYPILRLSRYFTEEKDMPQKVYIMTSVLLYHCCVCSHNGAVETDIYSKMAKDDQEMILKFCESLSDMEITINNVDIAIKTAFECYPRAGTSKKKTEKRTPTPHVSKSVLKDSDIPGSETESVATVSDVSPKKIRPKKGSTLTFKSSVTVMPSRISTDTSSFSRTSLQPDSSVDTTDTNSSKLEEVSGSTTASESITVFKIPEKDPQSGDSCFSGMQKKSIESRRIETTQMIPLSSAHKKESKEKKEMKVKDNSSKEKYPRPEEPKKPLGLGDPCSCTTCSSEGGSLPECGNCSKASSQSTVRTRAEDIEYPGGLQRVFFMSKHMFGKRENVDWSGPKKWIIIAILTLLLVLILITTLVLLLLPKEKKTKELSLSEGDIQRFSKLKLDFYSAWAWECKESLCIKVFQPMKTKNIHTSLSRCILLCSGPQIWPYPIGLTHFSQQLVVVATDKLEYKLQALPSELVNQYLAAAFKLFLEDLVRLERVDIKAKNRSHNIEVKKMYIQMEVESDSDPRLRVNTDESYDLKINELDDKIKININAASFCGVRHGLETLSQVILLDQSTGYLITLSEIRVKDAPSYKYRGLMLDTARNYIPVQDILRTIDGMSTCKLNTFHWRISDSASFPLLIPTLSKLFEFGAYDRSMVYTKDDVKAVVNRAGVRGIRVLMEVAIPGPVGRAWSWSDDATCSKKTDNFTCENVICLRLKMKERVFEILQHLYAEIIDMTGVDDVFHMSDSIFSFSNCHFRTEEREGFLEKALERLEFANKGFLPRLPIIWYTPHLNSEMEAKAWERFGVQVYEWPNQPDSSFNKFKVIHSSRWDLSCDIKKQRCTKYRSWQEMYAWRSWRTIESFSTEGGECLLWTDLVDSGNLDFHLWPRAAAVAERLWSDIVANATASGNVYLRLDNHRWRMLLRGMKVQPIWPVWCSFNPDACISKLHAYNKH